MRKTLALLLVSLMVVPTQLFAQNDTATILGDLPHGTRVKLTLATGRNVTGLMREARPDAVVLERAGLAGSKDLVLPAADGDGVRVDYTTITKAEISKQHKDLTKMILIGGAIAVGAWFVVNFTTRIRS